MHGRLKVKTDAQKEAERKKEEHEKLLKYQAARDLVFKLRPTLDDQLHNVTTQLLIFNCECNTFWNIRKEYVLKKLEEYEIKQETNSKLEFKKESGKQTEAKTDEKNEVVETDSKQELSTAKSVKQDGEKVDDESSLRTFLDQELVFTVQCLKKNPKAYAVWLYREFIMNHDGKADWENELRLCDEFLKADERNFHCWDYRRVVLPHITGRSKELELQFTTSKIEDNFSNFSSWHYRTKLLCGNERVIDCDVLGEERVREEFDLVYNALFTDPTDQSAWFYYKWLHGNRHSETLSILSIMVIRSFSSISLLFSKPVSKSQIKPTKIFLCSSMVRYTIKAVNSYTSFNSSEELSNHWILSIVSSSIPPFGKIEVDLQLPEQLEIKNCPKLVLEENDKMFSFVDPKPLLSQHVSGMQSAYPDVGKYDTELLLDLAKEEPMNKYVLIQLTELYRGRLLNNVDKTDVDVNKSKSLESLQKLISIDSLRASHYKDTNSDVILEAEIVQQKLILVGHKNQELNGCLVNGDADQPKSVDGDLKLPGFKLTQIRRITCLFMLSEIDLSENNLESIEPLAGFMNVKKLTLDKNKIKDLSPLYLCYSLKALSAKSNSIKSLDGFESLVDCHLMGVIDVSDNSVVDQEDFKEKLVLWFPRLEMLNGEPLSPD